MTASFEDDSALVHGALRGDAAAWNAIVARYGGLAFATARKAGLSRDEAEDASQTVFTALVRSLASLRDGQRLGGWILVAARREAWRLSRLRKRSGGGLPEDGSLPAEEDVREERAYERRQAVAKALAALDERCRELLRALFLGSREPDYKAVASEFDIALNSVGPIRNRCLRRMLDLLRAAGFEPSEHGFLNGEPRPADGRSENAEEDRGSGRTGRKAPRNEK